MAHEEVKEYEDDDFLSEGSDRDSDDEEQDIKPSRSCSNTTLLLIFFLTLLAGSAAAVSLKQNVTADTNTIDDNAVANPNALPPSAENSTASFSDIANVSEALRNTPGQKIVTVKPGKPNVPEELSLFRNALIAYQPSVTKSLRKERAPVSAELHEKIVEILEVKHFENSDSHVPKLVEFFREHADLEDYIIQHFGHNPVVLQALGFLALERNEYMRATYFYVETALKLPESITFGNVVMAVMGQIDLLLKQLEPSLYFLSVEKYARIIQEIELLKRAKFLIKHATKDVLFEHGSSKHFGEVFAGYLKHIDQLPTLEKFKTDKAIHERTNAEAKDEDHVSPFPLPEFYKAELNYACDFAFTHAMREMQLAHIIDKGVEDCLSWGLQVEEAPKKDLHVSEEDSKNKDLLIKSSAQGDPQAAFYLSQMFFNEATKSKDAAKQNELYLKAVLLAEQAAEQDPNNVFLVLNTFRIYQSDMFKKSGLHNTIPSYAITWQAQHINAFLTSANKHRLSPTMESVLREVLKQSNKWLPAKSAESFALARKAKNLDQQIAFTLHAISQSPRNSFYHAYFFAVVTEKIEEFTRRFEKVWQGDFSNFNSLEYFVYKQNIDKYIMLIARVKEALGIQKVPEGVAHVLLQYQAFPTFEELHTMGIQLPPRRTGLRSGTIDMRYSIGEMYKRAQLGDPMVSFMLYQLSLDHTLGIYNPNLAQVYLQQAILQATEEERKLLEKRVGSKEKVSFKVADTKEPLKASSEKQNAVSTLPDKLNAYRNAVLMAESSANGKIGIEKIDIERIHKEYAFEGFSFDLAHLLMPPEDASVKALLNEAMEYINSPATTGTIRHQPLLHQKIKDAAKKGFARASYILAIVESSGGRYAKASAYAAEALMSDRHNVKYQDIFLVAGTNLIKEFLATKQQSPSQLPRMTQLVSLMEFVMSNLKTLRNDADLEKKLKIISEWIEVFHQKTSGKKSDWWLYTIVGVGVASAFAWPIYYRLRYKRTHRVVAPLIEVETEEAKQARLEQEKRAEQAAKDAQKEKIKIKKIQEREQAEQKRQAEEKIQQEIRKKAADAARPGKIDRLRKQQQLYLKKISALQADVLDKKAKAGEHDIRGADDVLNLCEELLTQSWAIFTPEQAGVFTDDTIGILEEEFNQLKNRLDPEKSDTLIKFNKSWLHVEKHLPKQTTVSSLPSSASKVSASLSLKKPTKPAHRKYKESDKGKEEEVEDEKVVEEHSEEESVSPPAAVPAKVIHSPPLQRAHALGKSISAVLAVTLDQKDERPEDDYPDQATMMAARKKKKNKSAHAVEVNPIEKELESQTRQLKLLAFDRVDFEAHRLLKQRALHYRLVRLQLFLDEACHDKFAKKFCNILMHNYFNLERDALVECVKAHYSSALSQDSFQRVMKGKLYQTMKPRASRTPEELIMDCRELYNDLIRFQEISLKFVGYEMHPVYLDACKMTMMILGEIRARLHEISPELHNILKDPAHPLYSFMQELDQCRRWRNPEKHEANVAEVLDAAETMPFVVERITEQDIKDFVARVQTRYEKSGKSFDDLLAEITQSAPKPRMAPT